MQRLRVAIVCALVFSLKSPAHAEPAAAPRAPDASFPPVGATLPTNAKVMFFGPISPEPTFTRVGRAGELAFESFLNPDPFAPEGFELANMLVDPRVLGGLDEVRIQAACEGCEGTEAQWLVGGEDDVTPPVIAEGERTPPNVGSAGVEDIFGYRALGWSVTVQAPEVTDETGFVLARIETSEGGRTLSVATPFEGQTFLSAAFEPGPLRNVCFTATAIDLAGNEASFGPEVCADVGDDPRGCAAIGSAASAPSLLLLALLARTRKRFAR